MKQLVFILAVFAASLLEASGADEDVAPTWSKVYSVKGILYIPYAELEEPFSSWYDGNNDQSRIDYYGDMVKTYQLSKTFEYGTSLKIAPVTNEEVTNSKTCLQVNGTEDETVGAQNTLPDLTDFKLISKETAGNIEVEKWFLEVLIGQKTNEYTMWLRYDVDSKTGEKIAVPVKYSMKGYNTLLGSHYDHYYIDYFSFDPSEIKPETFQIEADMTCTSFPGPGNQHIYTFNPIKEFVRPTITTHVDHEFNKFVDKHSKNYENEKEHALRKEIFRQNVRFIHSVNRQNRGYTLAVNHLTDKTDNELKAFRGKIYTGESNGGQPFPHNNFKADDLPESFDWRILGAVSPVKDQSVCGSCWAFGTVGTVEGALFLKNGGNLIRLSEQALVDCSWGFGNNGCDGGEDFRSYDWMLKHGGLPTDAAYGNYLGEDGYCHVDDVEKVAVITGYVNVTTNDENALRVAIFKQGPISVSIDAGVKSFSFYSNGVYYEPNCGNKEEDLNHSVLAVGYGILNGKNYWLIKNSWSNLWGNDGYILMASEDNNCGVMTMPTYVTM